MKSFLFLITLICASCSTSKIDRVVASTPVINQPCYDSLSPSTDLGELKCTMVINEEKEEKFSIPKCSTNKAFKPNERSFSIDEFSFAIDSISDLNKSGYLSIVSSLVDNNSKMSLVSYNQVPKNIKRKNLKKHGMVKVLVNIEHVLNDRAIYVQCSR